MSSHSNGARAYYDAAGGTSYTEIPLKIHSIDFENGQTTKTPLPDLNATLALHPTEPGARQPGGATLHLRCDTPTHASYDFYELVKGWWTARTNPITLKIAYPKLSTDTNPPIDVRHGYVDQEPNISLPEDGAMMIDLHITFTDDATLTDAS